MRAGRQGSQATGAHRGRARLTSQGELGKQLRRGTEVQLDKLLQPGAAGEIETESTNVHALRAGRRARKRGSALSELVQLQPTDEGGSVIAQVRAERTTRVAPTRPHAPTSLVVVRSSATCLGSAKSQ